MIETYDILSSKQCNIIIDHFNNDSDKSPGTVAGDIIDPKMKLSIDLGCDFKRENQTRYHEVFIPALNAGLADYVIKYPYLSEGQQFTVWDQYNIQYYKDGEGYSVVHCETMPHKDSMFIHRMMAWMIYLNDAVSGTYFPYQDITIKPKQGMLVLWPSYWTHVHRGVVPNVGDKYIATGWFNYIQEE